jgi:hypothetical protein
MALRNAQGQRGKYLTLELSSTRNPVEDLCASVSKFQSAKIGDKRTVFVRIPGDCIRYVAGLLDHLGGAGMGALGAANAAGALGRGGRWFRTSPNAARSASRIRNSRP